VLPYIWIQTGKIGEKRNKVLRKVKEGKTKLQILINNHNQEKLRFYMAKEKTSSRLGTHGNIQLLKKGCNKGVGSKGLEKLGDSPDDPQQYVSSVNHKVDTQINLKKFGEVLQDGLQNTKEMAAKWNWRSDTDELNWRDNPCSLRIYYDSKKQILRVQVWNELIQVWAWLSLTKAEMLKILEG